MNRKIINNRVEKAVLGMFNSTTRYLQALSEAEYVVTVNGSCLNIRVAPDCSVTGEPCEIVVRAKDVVNLDLCSQ